MDKTDHTWQIRDAVDGDIQFADTKAGFIIGLALLGVALLGELPPSPPPWKSALVAVAGLLFSGAIVASILCVRPRAARTFGGTLFWGHIAAHGDFATYKQALEQSDALEEVARQAYEMARIARRKYLFIAYATDFLLGGLILLGVSL
ncbi:Pycsar system effector family protein [Meiothermus sp.]|uniref:Pycsar system effector family protein n=1 Tax=Meiothermus sp. TaxID=1955249 RepID=UPI0021DC99E4|nr:Pycsar system effector family protein [Meiothermus sp.]GIW24272.1 MAG: hypothetical protein KatS3mg069_0539 [Meiothermus sp.]